MPIFTIKTASRAVFRRPHFPNRQPNLTKQHHSTAPRAKPQDDSASGTSIPVPNTVATMPLWQRLGPLSRGFQAYGRSQRKRPYTTQFCSSLVIYFLGDLSAQNINGDEYNPARTLRALIISAGSSIPSYKWLVFLITLALHRTNAALQVYVPWKQLQLLLETPLSGHESNRQPNLLHANLQHIFLRHAIPSFR